MHFLNILCDHPWSPNKEYGSRLDLTRCSIALKPDWRPHCQRNYWTKSTENAGHLTRCHLCKGCLLAGRPMKFHCRVWDVDRATHVLHIKIAGHLNSSHKGFHYVFMGALGLSDLPLLIDFRSLRTRRSSRCCCQQSMAATEMDGLGNFARQPLRHSWK